MTKYLVSNRFLRVLGVRSRLHIDSLIGKVVITPESSVQILETVIGIQSKLAFDEWKYLKVEYVQCVVCVLCVGYAPYSLLPEGIVLRP
jgi:hypothetical protein